MKSPSTTQPKLLTATTLAALSLLISACGGGSSSAINDYKPESSTNLDAAYMQSWQSGCQSIRAIDPEANADVYMKVLQTITANATNTGYDNATTFFVYGNAQCSGATPEVTITGTKTLISPAGSATLATGEAVQRVLVTSVPKTLTYSGPRVSENNDYYFATLSNGTRLPPYLKTQKVPAESDTDKDIYYITDNILYYGQEAASEDAFPTALNKAYPSYKANF